MSNITFLKNLWTLSFIGKRRRIPVFSLKKGDQQLPAAPEEKKMNQSKLFNPIYLASKNVCAVNYGNLLNVWTLADMGHTSESL